MEILKPPTHSVHLTGLVFVALLTAILCAACGPQVIEGRPPFLRISELSTHGDSLSVEFDVSNQNEVEMNIDAIEIRVGIGGAEIVHDDPGFKLTVGANSAEDVHVVKNAPASLRDRLAELERGEIISLPFDLSGRVHTLEDGYLKFDQKGHLYPVPGKPGYYRSAVTQTKELQREKPY